MADIVLAGPTGGQNQDYFNGAADTITVAVLDTFQTAGPGYAIRVDAGDELDIYVDEDLTYSFTQVQGELAIDFSNGATLVLAGATPSNVDITIVCFTRGAKVATPEGEKLIEDLASGDLVMTRDNGAQPIRWIGSSKLSSEMLAQFPSRRPVTLKAGALGDHAETTVSPAHRVLVTGWRAEALFGESEVLATAGSLVNDRTIVRADVEEVEYFHMMFDNHELVMVDGMWSESFHPAAVATSLDAATRDEVLELFPELEVAADAPAARPAVDATDVKLMF